MKSNIHTNLFKKMKKKIERAKGKLGILMHGLGASAATFVAGVEAIKKGLAEPVASLTQAGNILMDKKTGTGYSKLREYISLAKVKDIVFGGWDTHNDNLFAVAAKAQIMQPGLLQRLKPELGMIVPMKAVEGGVTNVNIAQVRQAQDKFELAKRVMYDIEDFSVANNCTRLVVICFAPDERYIEVSEVHHSIEAFEEGLGNNHPAISTYMIYAFAALSLGVPFINGSGNLTIDIPALTELAKSTYTPVAGKNFKTLEAYKSAIFSPNLSDKVRLGFGNFAGNIPKKIVNFLPDDFIAAACIVLDVAVFIDLAKRATMRGIQEWLSFYFKAPQAYPRLEAEHDMFKQMVNLQNALFYLKSKELRAHFDLDYYE